MQEVGVIEKERLRMEKNIKICVGQEMKKARILRGFTQQVMADLLNISVSYYSDIETGEKLPLNMEFIDKMYLCLNLDILGYLHVLWASEIYTWGSKSLRK